MGTLIGTVVGCSAGVAAGAGVGYAGAKGTISALGEIGLTEKISNIDDVEMSLKLVAPSLGGACAGGIGGTIGGATLGHALFPPHHDEVE